MDYWDNKALPTPTLTLPDTLFSTFWLFPSFLLKTNAFLMRYEIWKGRKKIRQKAGSNSGRSRQNTYALSSMPLKLMLSYTVKNDRDFNSKKLWKCYSKNPLNG